jgi:hypothetical protein
MTVYSESSSEKRNKDSARLTMKCRAFETKSRWYMYCIYRCVLKG